MEAPYSHYEDRNAHPFDAFSHTNVPDAERQNALTFINLTPKNLTRGHSLQDRKEHYERIGEDAGDYIVEWGFKSDRKRMGIPDEIYEIRHAFGHPDNPADTCLVGYWYIWRTGNPELLGEVYRLPNRAIGEEALVRMIAQVAPEWFKDGPNGAGPDAGVMARLDPTPPGKSPGSTNELPANQEPPEVLLIGVAPAAIV